jgi:hypothetical protein
MVLIGTVSVTYIFSKVSTSIRIFELEGSFMAEKEARAQANRRVVFNFEQKKLYSMTINEILKED